jgi:ubiquinol-cytochrome c reductase cytochrome c1 subunit
MKELKILAVVVFFSLVTYYGVEPYAHSQMHKHVEGHGFAYADLNASGKKGNAEKGKELVMGAGACLGCHSLTAENMPAPMDAVSAAGAYGVNPPDLSVAGALYDEKFLANLIANPAHALKVEHKFDVNAGKMHPMVAFFGAGGDKDQEIADMVAYLKEIGEKQKVTPKVAYENACGRCHAMRYAKWTQIGTVPKTKPNITTHQDIEKLKFDQQVATYQESLAKYMGKLPPDLSIMIRARSKHFMETFVEDPQSQLAGTAMPRVGLSKEGYEKVEAYLEEIGDPSKPHREAVGPWVLGFFFIFTILAYLWKQAHWRDLH